MQPHPTGASADPTARSGAEAFSLYATLFAYGVGTGIYADVVADVGNARTAIWVPLSLGAAGIGTAYALDNPKKLRATRGYGMSTGLTLGFAAGIGLAADLDNRGAFKTCTTSPATTGPSGGTFPGFESCTTSSVGFASKIWLTSTAGLAAGYATSYFLEPRAPAFGFVNSTGLYGGLFGVLSAAMVRADSNSVPAAFLTGEAVGIGLGALGAHYLEPTESQTRWSTLGVLAGGLLGMGIVVLPGTDYKSATLPLAVVQASMLGGGVAGYLLGDDEASERGANHARLHLEPSVNVVPGGATLGLSLPGLL